MPIALRTAAHVEYVLPSDAAEPAESRAVFELKFLSARREAEVRAIFKAAGAEADPAKSLTLWVDGLRLAGVGWRNLPAKDADELPDVLTDYELGDLCGAVLQGPFLAEADRKKSRSPAPTPPEASATSKDAAAPAETGAASTD